MKVLPPDQQDRSELSGVHMRLMYFCYAAVGFAVARWIFRREAVPIVDPVSRFRAKGLM
jgi:hypothetical protein